jgi:diphthamide synthase (EF-2-diphthine--ammonia ligase)
MHGVRSTLVRRQADLLDLPLTIVLIPPDPTDQAYLQRMGSALADARERGIETVAFGDLFLEDIRAYREEMLAAAGMNAIFPLWGRPTGDLARRFLELGFRAVLTCVDTTQIAGEFAGRDYDAELLAELPTAADPCGEKGEFHTFVHTGPIFPRPLRFTRGEHVLRDNRFMYCDLVP